MANLGCPREQPTGGEASFELLDVVEQFHGHDRLPLVIPERRTVMKRYILALAALVTLTAGEIVAAQAQQFEVGPGGVYVGRDRYDGYNRDRYRGSYNRYGGGDSCGMWLHECARSYGRGTDGYEICMQRRAAVVACGR